MGRVRLCEDVNFISFSPLESCSDIVIYTQVYRYFKGLTLDAARPFKRKNILGFSGSMAFGSLLSIVLYKFISDDYIFRLGIKTYIFEFDYV